MTRIHTIMLVSCIALPPAAFSTIVAQETATASAPIETTTAATPTTASEPSNETTYYGDVTGDRAVRVVFAEYIGGTVVLVLESDLPWTVIVTTPASLISTDAVAGNLVRRPTPPGRAMIRIDSSEPRVTLVTLHSVENGRHTEIRSDDDGSALIAGPLTGTDV